MMSRCRLFGADFGLCLTGSNSGKGVPADCMIGYLIDWLAKSGSLSDFLLKHFILCDFASLRENFSRKVAEPAKKTERAKQMLETERLIIRKLTRDDLPWLVEMRTRPEVH